MSDEHYCKSCQGWFTVELGERVSGDFILECPHCGRTHYRHFALGEAVHCDITRRHDDPKRIKGVRIGASPF